MKNILLSALGVSLLWAGVGWSLLHWEYFYLLSAADMQLLGERFEEIYNRGYQAFMALQACRRNT